MSEDLNENAIKILKYIISNSKNGNVTISLDDISKQFGIGVNDIIDNLRKLEKIKAIKIMNFLSPNVILKTLVSEAVKYDLMYLSEKIDEETYKKMLEEILFKSNIKDLPMDKSCLTSNLIELKEALNNVEYLLQVIQEFTYQTSVKLKEEYKVETINALSNDFLDNLIYIYNFLTKLKLIGEVALESLEKFKEVRSKVKVITSEKLRKEYEDSREDFIKKSQNFLILASTFYKKISYIKEGNRKCDTCKKDMQINWKYCKFCGTKINQVFLPLYLIEEIPPKRIICPNCKTIFSEGNICPKCGLDFVAEMKYTEEAVLKLKEELELLKARRIIEGDALIKEIQEREAKYEETKSYLENLKKAFQETEYKSVMVPKYLIINVSTQELDLVLSKKINIFKELISKMKSSLSEYLEEISEDILEIEKELINYIVLISNELPSSLQEYNIITSESKELLICNSCGFKNDKDALFCIECGYKF